MRARTIVVGLVVLLALAFVPAQAVTFKPCLYPTIRGTSFSDFLLGTSQRDIIRGYQGNDIILGLGGADILCGNRGDDELSGGDGTDFVYGGPATDRCSARDYWQSCERGGA